MHHGLGSFHFARRYSGNRCFFLFLRLLRCFSSPGSPCMAMDSPCSDWSPSSRVSPFRHLRIVGYLPLPEAFRSLSRLSSALSAKASTLRSCSLNLLRASTRLRVFGSCLVSSRSLHRRDDGSGCLSSFLLLGVQFSRYMPHVPGILARRPMELLF